MAGADLGAVCAQALPMAAAQGHWGTLCGHYFWDGLQGADIVCKQLGYTYAVGVHSEPVPLADDPAALALPVREEDVEASPPAYALPVSKLRGPACDGTEPDLTRCPRKHSVHGTSLTRLCLHHLDQLVTCGGGAVRDSLCGSVPRRSPAAAALAAGDLLRRRVQAQANRTAALASNATRDGPP